MRRSDGAFTLLEVLAAVALLGILYTVLAGVAVQGLRAEGVARRRLAASLLADERLADIERDLALGILPPLEPFEDEVDDFRIRIEVTPFEPPPELFAVPGEEEQPPPTSPIAQPDPRQPVVVAIDLDVSWVEGDDEMSVQRTTFGYDLAAVTAAIPPDAAGALP